MKLLSYQAKTFSWSAHSQTLEEAAPSSSGQVSEAAVIWLHVERNDIGDDSRIFKKTLKHIKWIANNKSLKTIVLHSFAHLGGDTAEPDDAHAFLERLNTRLTNTGYEVKQTPFGWFCAWDLSIYGDSMAKVFKSF
ncbi:MAG: threonyl-tRNA synthetase editing domain-containing protein [Myxococcota bacterium]